MPRTSKMPQRNGSSPLQTYLGEISETSLLNAEEEKTLARRIQEGDSQARDQMVRANLRLVVNIARGFQGKGLGLEDLIAEGNLGLVHAVEAFDPTKETRFSTYASFWIKQSIQRTLLKLGKTIRLPAYIIALLSKWRRTKNQLQDQLGRTPLPEEVAKCLKLSKRKVAIINQAIQIHNATPNFEPTEDGWSVGEFLSDHDAHNPATKLADAEEVQQIIDLIDRLNEREARVIRMRFGLTDQDPQTLSEIGIQLDLTRERVRQIVRDALKKIIDALHRQITSAN